MFQAATPADLGFDQLKKTLESQGFQIKIAEDQSVLALKEGRNWPQIARQLSTAYWNLIGDPRGLTGGVMPAAAAPKVDQSFNFNVAVGGPMTPAQAQDTGRQIASAAYAEMRQRVRAEVWSS